jgi:hypothetical protein
MMPSLCVIVPREAQLPGGQYELGQMHRYEQAAYLCEHRKCDEHFLDRERGGIHHGFPNGADSIKVIEKPEIIIRGA